MTIFFWTHYISKEEICFVLNRALSILLIPSQGCLFIYTWNFVNHVACFAVYFTTCVAETARCFLTVVFSKRVWLNQCSLDRVVDYFDDFHVETMWFEDILTLIGQFFIRCGINKKDGFRVVPFLKPISSFFRFTSLPFFYVPITTSVHSLDSLVIFGEHIAILLRTISLKHRGSNLPWNYSNFFFQKKNES